MVVRLQQFTHAHVKEHGCLVKRKREEKRSGVKFAKWEKKKHGQKKVKNIG